MTSSKNMVYFFGHNQIQNFIPGKNTTILISEWILIVKLKANWHCDNQLFPSLLIFNINIKKEENFL